MESEGLQIDKNERKLVKLSKPGEKDKEGRLPGEVKHLRAWS